jgi:YYY domain-containing protein
VSVFLWLLVVEALGLLALPIAFTLFGSLRDRGYAFSKPLGLLLLAYPLWILGTLGVLPVTRWSIGLVLALLGIVAVLVVRRRWAEFWDFLWRERALLLGMEAVFLLLFLGWTAFHAFHPMVHHTEQLMDFAFLNASARATSFPPEDPWLRGHGVSYYYFGYLMMGLLTKLTGISSAVTYNLSLALVAAMASVGILGLVVTLVARAGASLRTAFLSGMVGVVLLGLVGNGEGSLELARARGLGSPGFWEGLEVKGLERPVAEAAWFPQETWWWWRATRVIDTLAGGRSLDYTIHEFPLFSFVLGDLHPHLMSIPFLLLAAAFGLELLLGRQPVTLRWLRERWTFLLLMGLALGALGFINAWDLPVFLGQTLGLLALKLYGFLADTASGKPSVDSLSERPFSSRRQGVLALFTKEGAPLSGSAVTGRGELIVGSGLAAGALGAVALAAYLPFYAGLDAPAPGILPVTGPITRHLHFAIVWAPFLVALAPLLVLQIAHASRRISLRRAGAAVALVAAPFAAWVLTALALDLEVAEGARFLHMAPGLALLALLVYRATGEVEQGRNAALVFTLALLALAGLLLTGPELFYVRDIFGSRMNTVFKLYYQAWVILAVASAVGLYYGLRIFTQGSRWLRAGGLLWLGLLAAVIAGGGYYTVGALADKAEGFRRSPTLDGLAFLKEQQAGEYGAIAWLRRHGKTGEGVLEAVGDDYSAHGRVSAATGLPTVLGWAGHERQWRGRFQPTEGRARDVAAIYGGGDVEAARRLLAQYRIRYVVVGPRERHAYGERGLAALAGLLQPVFAQEDVTIYRVRGEHD